MLALPDLPLSPNITRAYVALVYSELAASACAENARVCGNLIGAMQKFSPKRSLKLTLNNRIQKVLTLLAFRPRKMRTRSCFDEDMPIGARQFVLSHPKSRALLQETF